MGLLSALPVVGPIFKEVVKVINKAVPDKTKANELKAQIESALVALDSKTLESQARIVLGETQGSWMQRNWRPILMLTIVAVIANNYLLYPYLSLFWDDAPKIKLPDKLFSLLSIGLGGYVIGRSGEKMMKTWKQGQG